MFSIRLHLLLTSDLYLSKKRSTLPPIHPSTHPSIHPSTHPSIHLNYFTFENISGGWSQSQVTLGESVTLARSSAQHSANL